MTAPALQTAGQMIDIVAADTDIAKIAGNYPRAVFVGTGGTVKVMDPDGNISTHKVVAGGMIMGVVRQIRLTGTVTAADFVAHY